MKRNFDVNRRIAIPQKMLKELNIDYLSDTVEIYIKDGKIIIEKVEI